MNIYNSISGICVINVSTITYDASCNPLFTGDLEKPIHVGKCPLFNHLDFCFSSVTTHCNLTWWHCSGSRNEALVDSSQGEHV